MSEKSILNFKETLLKLSDAYQRDIAATGGQISEAEVRIQFLDPLFTALGWDVGNRALVPFYGRDVVVEPPYSMQGHSRRPDYLFKIAGIEKFVCEAKRPGEDLLRHHYQLQNYVFNLKIWVGILTDFEAFQVFLVGGQPSKDRPFSPLEGWTLHYSQYSSNAQKIWDLFSRDAVANGSLERLAQTAEKIYRPGRQGWLIKPDRASRIDEKFLQFLVEQRADLAKSLQRRNRRLSGEQLTEATQKIINRLLFQRICEDRNIDVGRALSSILQSWESGKRQKDQLWAGIVANFKHMQKTFNGGLYGKPKEAPHFIEELAVSEEWLSNFLEELAGDDSKYLLSVIPVEILGSVYERFLGSIVTATGDVTPKPEVRKSKGVYYTPKSIVTEIVERTVGSAIEGKSPKELKNFRVLDPACGSGSFLLGAYERICRHYLKWFMDHTAEQSATVCFRVGNDLRLTTGFKRKLLISSIYGVDIDPQAVEVTQMSLYLKVLEDETTQSLNADHRLFPSETYLPSLDKNIKVGNSLMDYSDLLTKEAEKTAFNWPAEFPAVIRSGGFDAVIGNPPYFSIEKTWGKGDPRIEYLKINYPLVYQDRSDILFYFLFRGYNLTKGSVCFIVSRAFLEAKKAEKLRGWLSKENAIDLIIDFRDRHIFEKIGIATAIVRLDKLDKTPETLVYCAKSENDDERPISSQLSDAETFERTVIAKSKFNSKSWLFGNNAQQLLIAKIDKNKLPLTSVFEVGQGMQTGLNKAFGSLPLSVAKDWKIPKGAWFVRARNSDIKKWVIDPKDHLLLYPNAFSRFSDMPVEMRNHLNKFKTKLAKRAACIRGDCEWWQFTWPLHAELYSRPKILCPYLSKENRFALDDKHRFLGLTDTTVLFPKKTKENTRFFLGLLNSNILTWRFRFIGKLKGGGIREYFHNSIAQLPICRIDLSSPEQKAFHDKVVSNVSKLLILSEERNASQSISASKANLIDTLEAEINEIFRILYGLSEKEYADICLTLQDGSSENDVIDEEHDDD